MRALDGPRARAGILGPPWTFHKQRCKKSLQQEGSSSLGPHKKQVAALIAEPGREDRA